ncbi:hypothetical protein C8J56DRAFT_895079 [Mycena floridula]|nr:hypothetical protein C8J56DRAFT_895079 [Mycena floridula]
MRHSHLELQVKTWRFRLQSHRFTNVGLSGQWIPGDGILGLIEPGNVRVPHGLYVRYNQLIFGITWSTLLFLGGSSACYGTIPLNNLARIPGAKQGALALQASPQHIDNTLANNRQIYQTPAQSYRLNMFY